MAPCRRIAAPALYATFGSCLIYASGLAFVPVWIAIEARGVPEPDSVLWRLVFPLQSLTSPTALHDVVASGDPTRLPWFDEAAPWFLLAVVVEVVIDVALLGGRLYALNDAVGSLALGLLSRVGGWNAALIAVALPLNGACSPYIGSSVATSGIVCCAFAASMKLAKSGCGSKGRDFSSG